MNEVAKIPNTNEAPADLPSVSDSAAIIQVIERAASNPDVDIEKMERLLDMQERILNRNAKAAYVAALADVQQELPAIKERGEIKNNSGKVQSRYALWEDINEKIKPILHKHGFALSFRTGTQDGQMVVTGVLAHREGHSEETSIYLPADTSGSKNQVQAVGSSTSYGKRYTAQALLNLTSTGEDDDGQKAGVGTTVTEEQEATISAKMKEVGADPEKFLQHLGVSQLADLPATKFNFAMSALAAKQRRQG